MRLEKQKDVLQSFGYALFPTMMGSFPVDWHYLATERKVVQSIRIHRLQMGKNLPEILKSLDRNYVKALVLVNTEENYIIPWEMVTSVKDVPFPLLVVKKSDGQEIFRCVERHIGDSIYARVDPGNEYRGEVPLKKSRVNLVVFCDSHTFFYYKVSRLYLHQSIGQSKCKN